jgi:nucleoside-diphosphate-sugar epimerase
LEDGRPGDVHRHFADVTKAQRLLGFRATVDIENGIMQYVQWVQQQGFDLVSWLEQERVQNW